MLASRRGHGGVVLASALIGTIAVAGLSAAILSLLLAMFTRRGGLRTSASPAVGSVGPRPARGGAARGRAAKIGGPGDRARARIYGAGPTGPARAPRQLRRARRRHVPDRHGDGRAAVPDAAADHVGRPLGDRLQARHRARRRPDRRPAAGARPVVGAGRPARHPVRGRVVVGAGADRAPAGDRRRQPPRSERSLEAGADPAPAAEQDPAVRARGSSCRSRGARSRPATARSCSPTASPPRPPTRRSRSGRSSPPATRSSASRTSTAAATASRCPRSRPRTTARAASSTCCTARGLLPVDYDAPSGTLESFGEPGPGPVGHAVRERRPRVHVRRRPALGHAQRRRPRRREHRDRLASADPQRRRVRGAPSGGAVTGAARRASAACALCAAGCGASAPAGHDVLERRPANHVRDRPGPGHARVPVPATAAPDRDRAPPPTAAEAIRAFVTAYINWNAQTVSADMRSLAARSVGQARAAMTLAAAETAGDYELQRGGIANSGTVEAVAPLPGPATSTSWSRASRRPRRTPPPTRVCARPGTSRSPPWPRSPPASGC